LTSQEPHITIAVDAMGGDFAPAPVVAGVAEAVGDCNGRFAVTLAGPEEQLRAELAKHSIPPGSVTIAPASEVVDMHDAPTAAVKAKKDSSIAVGLRLHREGRADAFVSAGNTGAVLSASTLILGRVEGVGRPTIGALVPTATSRCLLVDAGANIDCRARHLFEFGVMGSIFVSSMLGIEKPRVGLVNIGEEERKGNEVTREAYALFKASPLNFVGNVEGRDILHGAADVIVCDGFVGNILLKFGESVPQFLKKRFLRFAKGNLKNTLVALIARGALRSVLKELDYQEHGGVPLLGVDGVSIIGHGSSTPKAFKNMLFRAEEMVYKKVNEQIREALVHTT
jgi:glycerol-3-phosphate acyltransferase PlsX